MSRVSANVIPSPTPGFTLAYFRLIRVGFVSIGANSSQSGPSRNPRFLPFYAVFEHILDIAYNPGGQEAAGSLNLPPFHARSGSGLPLF